MRTIRRTRAFRRDFRRERRGRFAKRLDLDLARMVAELAADRKIEERHRDHALAGQWSDHRDCHLRPDLILIDRKPDDDHLDLVRLGSRGELGL